MKVWEIPKEFKALPGPTVQECIDGLRACSETLKALPAYYWTRNPNFEEDNQIVTEPDTRAALLKCIVHLAGRLLAAATIVLIAKETAEENPNEKVSAP